MLNLFSENKTTINMKNITICLLLFLNFSSFALDPFIIKKDGSKQAIKSNSFHVDQAEKVIYYLLENDQTEVKMSFNDFSSVEFGVSKFKTFRLNNSKKVEGYFVLAESESKSLISIFKPDLENEDSKTFFYEFHVIDKNNTIIESHFFNNIIDQKNADLRNDIYTKIRFYFENCSTLSKILEMYDSNNYSKTNENTKILEFFNSHVYYQCN
jgi:hypothetical protein